MIPLWPLCPLSVVLYRLNNVFVAKLMNLMQLLRLFLAQDHKFAEEVCSFAQDQINFMDACTDYWLAY